MGDDTGPSSASGGGLDAGVLAMLGFNPDDFAALAGKRVPQLRSAIRAGDSDAVQRLLADPACDVSADENAALRAAWDEGMFDAVRAIMAHGRFDPSPGLRLATSVCEGTALLAKLLRHEKLDPTAEGHLPLRHAAREGDTHAFARHLRDPRADPSAVFELVYRRDDECTALLAADPRLDPTVSDCLPMRWAAETGRLQELCLFLSHPAVDAAAHNNAAIEASVEGGHAEAAERLLLTCCTHPAVERLPGIPALVSAPRMLALQATTTWTRRAAAMCAWSSKQRGRAAAGAHVSAMTP